MVFQEDLGKLMSDVFVNVIFNWSTLSQDPQIMNVVDMNRNSLCQKLKAENPTMRDSFIQAHVVSILILFMIVLSMPIQNPFDEYSNENYYLMNEDESLFNSYINDNNDINIDDNVSTD